MSERIDTDTLHVDDMHVVQPRAAGLDVHKMCITAAVRLCEAGRGLARTAVREFSALPDGLRAMTDWLRSHGVTAAAMEGTGVYWKAPFEALEDAGIHAELFHAQHVKQIRGKKTDVNDSLWLARICQFGLALPSYVPPRQFRQLRQLTRYRRTLVAERSRNRNRVHKTLDHDGLRLGGILSDIFGVNGRRILDGLVAGHPPGRILAGLTTHVQAKLEPLAQALAAALDPLALLKLQMRAGPCPLAAVARRGGCRPSCAGRVVAGTPRLCRRRRTRSVAGGLLELRDRPLDSGGRGLGRTRRQGVRPAPPLRRLLQYPALALHHCDRRQPVPGPVPRRHHD